MSPDDELRQRLQALVDGGKTTSALRHALHTTTQRIDQVLAGGTFRNPAEMLERLDYWEETGVPMEGEGSGAGSCPARAAAIVELLLGECANGDLVMALNRSRVPPGKPTKAKEAV